MRRHAESIAIASGYSTREAALTLSPTVLVDLLSLLSTAQSRRDVAEAACLALGDVHGVRTVALLRRGVTDAVLMACTGYGSDLLAVGSRIPLAGGFPAAQAIRTGNASAQPGGRGWLALPLEPRPRASGALLLGLSVTPPSEPDSIVVLECVVTALSAAYRAIDAAERKLLRAAA